MGLILWPPFGTKAVIHLQENMLDKNTVAIEVDGVLDAGAVPLLKGVCDRHLGLGREVLVNLRSVVHITREGRVFIHRMRGRVRVSNLPEFMNLETDF